MFVRIVIDHVRDIGLVTIHKINVDEKHEQKIIYDIIDRRISFIVFKINRKIKMFSEFYYSVLYPAATLMKIPWT